MNGSRANDEFVRQFVRCQQDLYAYILSLLPNIADAQDVLQETAIALWAKADEFRADEPFMPWAAKFAWFQVRKFRMYQARRGRHVMALSDEALDALAAEQAEFQAAELDRGTILQQCVDKLGEFERALLRQRYGRQTTIRELAAAGGVEPSQLYKRLARIRQTLQDCVSKNTSRENIQ